jgi:hypothetical protein
MRWVRVTPLILGLVLTSCAHEAAVPPVQPRVLSGVLIVRNNDGGEAKPAGDVVIGVYRQAVPAGGPVMYPPPTPAATTRTDEKGVFRFSDLPAGRWFVQSISPPGYAPGRWVRYEPGRGATITLYACRDCPVPV